MNIFAFDKCPMQSALWLDDIRKNKMILESAQMLSTAVRLLIGTPIEVRVKHGSGVRLKQHWLLPNEDIKEIGESVTLFSNLFSDSIYKVAYANHPCTIWARQSRGNFKWLLSHMSHLFLQKHGNHNSSRLIPMLEKYGDEIHFAEEGLTEFANCARNQERGVDYSHYKDVHEAYRLYMNDRWKERNITLTWRWGEQPEWKE